MDQFKPNIKEAKLKLKPFLRKLIVKLSDQIEKRNKLQKKNPLFASDVMVLK
jgi:hypothetical protein